MMKNPAAKRNSPPDTAIKAQSGGFARVKRATGTTQDPLAAADRSFESLEGSQYSLQERPTLTVTLPQGWARALLAGVEAALFGWLIPTVAFLLSYLAVSANPWLKDFAIGEAAQMGTEFWASSLGANIELGGVPISFVPLTWTLVQMVVLRLLLMGGREFDSAALWTAAPAFVATTALILALGSELSLMLPALAGATAVALTGTLWAITAQTERFPKWVRRLGWAWQGLRMGLLWAGVAALVSLVAVAASVATSWDAITETRTVLTGGGLAGLSLAALELAYLPVFGAWALAWISGAGFTLPDGVFHSALSSPGPVVPILPIAQAVPQTAPGSWVPVILGACGLALGLWASVRAARSSFMETLRRGAVALVAFTGIMFVWMWASTGSLGVGALAHLGPTPLAWLAVSALVAGVAFVVLVLTHPQTRETVQEWLATKNVSAPAEREVTKHDVE